MTTAAIVVDGLVKRYRGAERNAVDGVSFTVERGAFFTLLGPNGAGKTTTMNILTTILAPTGGTARVAGHNVRTEQSEVRRRVGIISLIDDRETDFAQEIFVSPISRYTIVAGKILGETLVASPVAVGIVIFAVVLGVPLGPERLTALALGGLIAAFFGGSFGVLVLANLPNRRAAQNVFPFLMLPQYFLSGIFDPIAVLPWYLDVASRISPMRYAVDLVRGLFYRDAPEHGKVVLQDPATVVAIIGATFVAFMMAGTALFVRRERER